jgi:colanic acid biosynthesis glycosyl transferase WcaI
VLVQLWSCNYEPEPMGIGPISATWAKAMRDRGYDVEVVAAHPHYPEPVWGRPLRPYREERDGISVLRLPIWPGRSTTMTRLRQEASFALALTLSLPYAGRPDAVVAVSPSFPALLPTMIGVARRRIPWVLWLQDILPDGATATGVMESGPAVRLARRLEHAAYRAASHVVVLSSGFERNLVSKGVPQEKIVRAYNPATRPVRAAPRDPAAIEAGRVLTMGNIGRSQGLARLVRAFEDDPGLADRGARFVIAGDGVAAGEVRAEVRTDRVSTTGIIDYHELGEELSRAQVAVVSQHYDGEEFNVPSKLMNFMAEGVPVVASVRGDSEAARIVRESGCGWVTESSDLEAFTRTLADALDDPDECRRRGTAGLAFAQRHFTPQLLAEIFDGVVSTAVNGGRANQNGRPHR